LTYFFIYVIVPWIDAVLNESLFRLIAGCFFFFEQILFMAERAHMPCAFLIQFWSSSKPRGKKYPPSVLSCFQNMINGPWCFLVCMLATCWGPRPTSHPPVYPSGVWRYGFIQYDPCLILFMYLWPTYYTF